MRTVLSEGLLADDVAEAVKTIRQQLVDSGDFSVGEVSLANNIVQNTLEANRFYNKEATEQAKKAAAESVEEVTYKKGQNIVREGEILSEAQYQLIKQLGLISSGSHAVARWASGALLMLALFAVGALFAFVTDRSLIDNQKTVMQIVTMLALGVILGLVCKRIDRRLCPVFIFSILGAVVLKRRTAIFFSIFTSIVVSFVMSPQEALFFDERVLRQLTAGILGSIVSVLLMSKKQKRSEYIVARAGRRGDGVARVPELWCDQRLYVAGIHGDASLCGGERAGFRIHVGGHSAHLGNHFFHRDAVQIVGAHRPFAAAAPQAHGRSAGHLSPQHHGGEPGRGGGRGNRRGCVADARRSLLPRCGQAVRPVDVQGKSDQCAQSARLADAQGKRAHHSQACAGRRQDGDPERPATERGGHHFAAPRRQHGELFLLYGKAAGRGGRKGFPLPGEKGRRRRRQVS